MLEILAEVYIDHYEVDIQCRFDRDMEWCCTINRLFKPLYCVGGVGFLPSAKPYRMRIFYIVFNFNISTTHHPSNYLCIGFCKYFLLIKIE
jgi:hypothetical protein